MKQPVGLASVYVMHSAGFRGHLRPAHDSAATSAALMTDAEVRTLKGRIARYMKECLDRRIKEGNTYIT